MKKQLQKKYIEVILISFATGYEVFHDVHMVRLRDKRSNLLIMVDYMPTLGEMDGELEIVTDNDVRKLEGVKGFYCIKNNVFKILLKEDSEVG